MTQPKSIDVKSLIEEAKASRDKEAFKLLEKTNYYRIGIGARINAPASAYFFIEVIIALSPGNDEVRLSYLEKSLSSLKTLQEEGYRLTFQDDKISCEKIISPLKMFKEYTRAKSITRSTCKGV